MDDRFLSLMRRDPDPGFARGLRRRLGAGDPPPRAWALRPLPAFSIAIAALAVVSLFAFPAVRVSAQAMLDLFRVRKFAAIPFDDSRLEKLRSLGGDDANGMMPFDRRETVRDPGPPRIYPDPAAAGAAAGLTVRRPGFVPNGMALDTVAVNGAAEMRVAVSEPRLRAMLDALDLRDVTVPAGIDGKTVDVRTSPVVVQHFRAGRWSAALIQSMSPEVSVPAGLDVEQLAEIGLRVLGLDASEARRVARATDWRSTLLVPVPLNAGTFRQVTVHGQSGLLITTTGRGAAGPGPHRDGCMVLWNEGDRVFAIMGNLGSADAMEMAESVQ
jgi:hypothetical protein